MPEAPSEARRKGVDGMRVAFTGSSSTGKSTLASALMKVESFRRLAPRYLPSEGREILSELGFTGLDTMTQDQTAFYELAYFARKVSRELSADAFLTDRSFVDVAAYWIERDAKGRGAYLESLLVDPCQRLARGYDLHFLLPMGLIPFEEDGRRSSDGQFHARIDACIRRLLDQWCIAYVEVTETELSGRVELVLKALGQRRADVPIGDRLTNANSTFREGS
ncbi:ATP-binding protein [Micromonospora sp. NPDC049836]|uniref:ATP-binding protein n=1 Tax=Micromonospora sp. NPDC049836 TaxID=3364274 RepID=UPI0037B50073